MTKTITPSQSRFIWGLSQERDLPEAFQQKVGLALSTENYPLPAASALIGQLLKLPKVPAPTVSHTPPAAKKAPGPEAKPGVYQLDGKIYVVKPNQAKTHTYAKELVASADHVTVAGTTIPFDLVYRPGVAKLLTEADRMPLADAEELMIKFGKCICCGRTLKAAQSVKQGIGPVCIKYFA